MTQLQFRFPDTMFGNVSMAKGFMYLVGVGYEETILILVTLTLGLTIYHPFKLVSCSKKLIK